MLEVYDAISDLMMLAVDHWVEHCPQMTLRLLKEGTFGERVLQAAQRAQRQVYAEPTEDRDAIWETVREDELLLQEEPIVEENPERAKALREAISELIDAQYPYSREKDRMNNALQVTGWTLERKGIPADWTPEDPDLERAESEAANTLKALRNP